MSVFIPQEWTEDQEIDLQPYAKMTDLQPYAKKTELTNFIQRETDGSLNLEGKRIANVAQPVSSNDVVTKQYLDSRPNNGKPVICITGEAVGNLRAGTACFSFGGKSYQYAERNSGTTDSNGVVMPASGRIKYLTVCTTNSSGSAPSHAGLEFAVIVNTTNRQRTEAIAKINAGNLSTSKRFNPPYTVNAGDRINLYSINNSPHSFMTVASVFIELDI